MTTLSPATPVLPVLEAVGERLMRADLGIGGPLPFANAAERRAHLAHIRTEAALRASVDLDGAYSADLRMVYLLRALEAVCELETSPGTRRGTHLLHARFRLREAAKAVHAAVRVREIQATLEKVA
jgi:hypothetical protein